MNEPQLPLASGPETLIVYSHSEDAHERVHIDGYCSDARAPGPLPDHEVRYGAWTASNCTPCRLMYRKAVLGETVEPAHKPGGAA